MNNVTTFDNFPPFATNGRRNMNTESAKYAVGFLEGETFPAEWANYLFHGATKGVSDLNTAVQSIWKENINVIQGSGQTPSSSDNTQLKTAIELMIKNAVLTANAQVLAQAKLDAHPVGSLYWSSDPTNPKELFGGEWKQITDKFIYATGRMSVNATGGSETVRLTESNLPAHTHYYSGTVGSVSAKYGSANTGNMSANATGTFIAKQPAGGLSGEPTGNISVMERANQEGENRQANFPAKYKIDVSHTHNFDHQHDYSGTTYGGNGTSTAFSVLPPYIVKYCWERVS